MAPSNPPRRVRRRSREHLARGALDGRDARMRIRCRALAPLGGRPPWDSQHQLGLGRSELAGPGRALARGIVVHSGDTLSSPDVCVAAAIPCTTVARTIFDLSAVLNRDALEYALHRAQSRSE